MRQSELLANVPDLVFEAKETSESVDLVGIVRQAARRWPIIILAPIVLIGLAHIGFRYLPVHYMASAQLLLFDPLRSSTISLARNVSPVRDLDAITINTELQVIKSEAALEQVARSLRLDTIQEFQSVGVVGALGSAVGDVLGLAKADQDGAATDGDIGPTPTALARAVFNLRKHIAVERVPLSYVVTVSATAGQPQLAYQLVTNLVRRYLDAREENFQQSLDQSAAFLRSKVDELQARVESTKSAIERLRAGAGVSQDGKSTLLEQQRADLAAKLLAVRAEIAEQKDRLELVRHIGPGDNNALAASDRVSSPTLNQLRLQLSILLRDAAQLRDRFGPRHAQVLSIEERISTLQRAIGDEITRTITEQEANYALALRREQSLAADLDRLRSSETDTGALARLQELQNAADADAKLLATYSSRLDDVQGAGSLRLSGDRILSSAVVPSVPNAPPKALIYAGAGALGLVCGLALSFVMALFRPDVRPAGPGQLRFGEPVLGNIPMLKGFPDWRAIAYSAGKAEAAMAHAIHAVRVGLELHSRGDGARVIVVTSARRQEGTSTVAASLAVAAAGDGLRTVLVACGLDGRTLARDIDLGFPVIAVATGPNTRGQATSPRLREIVTRLQSEFAYIVIDAPPVLPVPEVCGMTSFADSIVMVVDSRPTSTKHLKQALAVLSLTGQRFAGIVLNKQPLRRLRRLELLPDTAKVGWAVKRNRRSRAGVQAGLRQVTPMASPDDSPRKAGLKFGSDVSGLNRSQQLSQHPFLQSSVHGTV